MLDVGKDYCKRRKATVNITSFRLFYKGLQVFTALNIKQETGGSTMGVAYERKMTLNSNQQINTHKIV